MSIVLPTVFVNFSVEESDAVVFTMNASSVPALVSSSSMGLISRRQTIMSGVGLFADSLEKFSTQ